MLFRSCIPAYRSEAYIATCIQSVLDQTFTDFELIIIDDASPDRTYDVIRGFTDPRVRASQQSTNVALVPTGMQSSRLRLGATSNSCPATTRCTPPAWRARWLP